MQHSPTFTNARTEADSAVWKTTVEAHGINDKNGDKCNDKLRRQFVKRRRCLVDPTC